MTEVTITNKIMSEKSQNIIVTCRKLSLITAIVFTGLFGLFLGTALIFG